MGKVSCGKLVTLHISHMAKHGKEDFAEAVEQVMNRPLLPVDLYSSYSLELCLFWEQRLSIIYVFKLPKSVSSTILQVCKMKRISGTIDEQAAVSYCNA